MPDSNEVIASPYDLITEDLVWTALKDDMCSTTELLSWEIKDFTKKGDNYASLVTSILVKYVKDGENLEKSYICKLNPMRPISEMTDFVECTYGRETIMLSKVIAGMNRELESLNLSSMKCPRVFAWNLEKRKEIFVAEDLRTQGFKMYDRTRGMDANHALLILEELGRFQASSLLFEDTLANKSIPNTYDYFEDPWNSENNNICTLFMSMIAALCKNATILLSNSPKYESCVKWINSRAENVCKMYIDHNKPSGKLNVLTHGDCWTNNVVFKYDDEGRPIDVRLLDFQVSRKSSPACDLNYFFYSSLDRRTVRENYRKFLDTYYLSFSKVLLLAKREPPFSYLEFEEEMEKRKMFGIFAGMFMLPFVLAEGEEINYDPFLLTEDSIDGTIIKLNEKYSMMSKRNGPFNDRFLSMFDEVIEKRIFELADTRKLRQRGPSS